MARVTLGGERIGSGNKMKVDMHGFERSTHDMSYIWRSTMAPGTLVPFLCEVALPGDTFDIDLNAHINTHPTIGPLFGSFKVQFDVYQVPVRLYHSALHNNALGIGMDMKSVKLPYFGYTVRNIVGTDVDNQQIDPSSLLAYLGLRGAAATTQALAGQQWRTFNAIPLLAYWDIYKNYYSNKQEAVGYVIKKDMTYSYAVVESADMVYTDSNGQEQTLSIPQYPNFQIGTLQKKWDVRIVYGNSGNLDGTDIILMLSNGTKKNVDELTGGQYTKTFDTPTGKWTIEGTIIDAYAQYTARSWDYADYKTKTTYPPKLEKFPLENIDKVREQILAKPPKQRYSLHDSGGLEPYDCVYTYWGPEAGISFTGSMFPQQGLGVKTYQSDLFNNWLNTEWITGPGGINEITQVDTSQGYFNIDSLNLAKKVYDMLNRIAVTGGTYDDWLEAVYDHEAYGRAETPVYCGGLSKELVFQEVVSNSATEQGQPLGTLAGRGVLGNKHKGGKVVIKVNEPSYIMGIVSLTPRLDYSQGNKWDVNLETLDDLHKPSLDQIGFQDLIAEQMAWWSTTMPNNEEVFVYQSPGKQPAWLNYMTNVNVVRGNFAKQDNEMFMVLTRRYEVEYDPISGLPKIGDLTTYIDPSKYNHIFAETSIDAQNFWVQISVDMIARRKMSAKIMPNL